eukprot:m.1348920 g.1348920  ORF g.1348920 m.1348920 type:complete len:109 (+) comp24916_c0_seq2:172-498(+)
MVLQHSLRAAAWTATSLQRQTANQQRLRARHRPDVITHQPLPTVAPKQHAALPWQPNHAFGYLCAEESIALEWRGPFDPCSSVSNSSLDTCVSEETFDPVATEGGNTK